jgi:Na+-driven multidrug efflux pump
MNNAEDAISTRFSFICVNIPDLQCRQMSAWWQLILTIPRPAEEAAYAPAVLLCCSPDAGSLTLAATLLVLAGLFQLADGAQVMALGLLRGVQDTRVPMILAALAYWAAGIPASCLLGFTLGWGAPGIWSGLVLGLVIAGALLMWRFWTKSVRIG